MVEHKVEEESHSNIPEEINKLDCNDYELRDMIMMRKDYGDGERTYLITL